MALEKGVNSYVTVAEADAYFADRLEADVWSGSSAAVKAQALITATSIIDQYEFLGEAVSDTQPLAFPRKGVYFDTKLGRNVEFAPFVPDRVLVGTYELALHLMSNTDVLNPSGTVGSIKVDVIELKYIKNSEKSPERVRSILRPLRRNSSQQWWRAN
jgi:hypothetical protein